MRDLYIKESSVQHWISLKKHKIIFNRMFYVGIINEGCKCDIVPLKKKTSVILLVALNYCGHLFSTTTRVFVYLV